MKMYNLTVVLFFKAEVAVGEDPASNSFAAGGVHDQQPAPIAQHRAPQYSYAPHGVRTYTSLEDVGASDDDSDEDKF